MFGNIFSIIQVLVKVALFLRQEHQEVAFDVATENLGSRLMVELDDQR